jgi:hypothetical protein
MVAAKINAASMTAIATIRTTVWLILHVAKVHRASATLTRAAVDFNVIDEIGFNSHISNLNSSKLINQQVHQ